MFFEEKFKAHTEIKPEAGRENEQDSLFVEAVLPFYPAWDKYIISNWAEGGKLPGS